MLQPIIGNAVAAVQGNLDRTNFQSSACTIASMQISFKLDEAFGEPLITSKMRWQAGPDTDADCLSPLSNIWLKARTPNNEFRYVNVNPTIPKAGIGFGSTATESPNWTSLLCISPKDNSQCEDASTALTSINSDLRFESFEVVSETSAVENVATSTQNQTEDRASTASKYANNSNTDFSFESALDDIIDGSISSRDDGNTNGASTRTDTLANTPLTQSAATDSNTKNAVNHQQAVTEQDRPQVKSRMTNDQTTTANAEVALANIVRIMSTSMSEFVTKSHTCESQRTVGHWVQARGFCELNFRSETNYNYLCSDDGKPDAIRSTRQFNLNIGSDLAHVSDIRLSDEGWLALVLETKSNAHSNSEADYQTNRWQFTTDADKLSDLQLLAGSLLTLKKHCTSQDTESNKQSEENVSFRDIYHNVVASK